MSMKIIAAELRAIAEQLEGSENGWAYGAAQFSPADAEGFVMSREVEVQLIGKHGLTVQPPPAPEGTEQPGEVAIPRYFRFRGALTGDESQDVLDLVEVCTASAGFNGNRPITDISGMYTMTPGNKMSVEKGREWDEFFLDLTHRTNRLLTYGSGVNSYFPLKTDERTYG